MKTAVLAPFALVLGTLALAGCDSQPTQPPAAPRTNAPEGISITDGRLVLPAVKGNPGAVYFTVHNDSADTETIRHAAVKGAKSAMIHTVTVLDGKADMEEMPQVPVPAHGQLAFEPGKLHVMAMDLDDTLQKGGTTDVTLEFAGGDQAEFPVQILAAGDAR
jgi:copper(I)-binding protein